MSEHDVPPGDVSGAAVLAPPPRRFAWRRLTAGLLLFVVGLLCGGVLGMHLARRRVHQMVMNPERVADRMVQDMTGRLHLDAAQQKRIRAIIDQRQEALKNVRQETRTKIDGVFDTSDQQIEAALRPEQVATWREFCERMKRWRPAFPDRGPHGGPHGPHRGLHGAPDGPPPGPPPPGPPPGPPPDGGWPPPP